MKNLLASITILFSAVILLSSCSEEIRLAKNIDGNWKVVTYELNGDSFISFLNSFDITYNEYDKGASEGTFTWIIKDLNGDTDTTTGKYSINDDGTMIDLIIDNKINTFNISVEENILKMNGTIDSNDYVIEANR